MRRQDAKAAAELLRKESFWKKELENVNILSQNFNGQNNWHVEIVLQGQDDEGQAIAPMLVDDPEIVNKVIEFMFEQIADKVNHLGNEIEDL